jgi:hypothetical protein
MFDASNWYWVVASGTAQVYHSARVAYVLPSDAAYVAWLAAGNLPTQIPSAAELLGVLQQQWLPLVIGQGCAIVSTGTPALNATYALDPVTVQNLEALVDDITAGKPLPGGGSTIEYPTLDGPQIAFTGPQLVTLGAALVEYEYSAMQALTTIVMGGSASLPVQPVTIA